MSQLQFNADGSSNMNVGSIEFSLTAEREELPIVMPDRAEYRAECDKRWHGPALIDAHGHWQHWKELHGHLLKAMRTFRINPGMVDLNGKWHADGSLTDFLWKLQSAWQPDKGRLDPLLDFCEHYQKVHLRRGLIIYCTQLLKAIANPIHPETTVTLKQ